jgi:hypothetical protein
MVVRIHRAKADLFRTSRSHHMARFSRRGDACGDRQAYIAST